MSLREGDGVNLQCPGNMHILSAFYGDPSGAPGCYQDVTTRLQRQVQDGRRLVIAGGPNNDLHRGTFAQSSESLSLSQKRDKEREREREREREGERREKKRRGEKRRRC